MTAEVRFRSDSDVYLRIWLTDIAFDYWADVAAIPSLVRDWRKKRWCTIELIQNAVDDCRRLPRLPCERLFLGP